MTKIMILLATPRLKMKKCIVKRSKTLLKCIGLDFLFTTASNIGFLTHSLWVTVLMWVLYLILQSLHIFLQGDSGGPLVCPDSNGIGKLAGIVSFGMTACNAMAGFTRVSYYQDWILARLEK